MKNQKEKIYLIRKGKKIEHVPKAGIVDTNNNNFKVTTKHENIHIGTGSNLSICRTTGTDDQPTDNRNWVSTGVCPHKIGRQAGRPYKCNN
jgi:hypothetical protein